MRSLADACARFGIEKFGTYGDFDAACNAESLKFSSFLREFGTELAREFAKEDCVIMPSGVMAQQIALKMGLRSDNVLFACHPTSHLLLHEEMAFRELSQLHALIVESRKNDDDDSMTLPPLCFDDLRQVVKEAVYQNNKIVSAALMELPHREIGKIDTLWRLGKNIWSLS
jgi:threonine aldolase